MSLGGVEELGLVVGMFAVGVLGCGGDGGDESAATQPTTSAPTASTTVATTIATASTTSVTPTTADPPETTATVAPTSRPLVVHCPYPHGGNCLGGIAAGTYTTTSFEPSITYTVPDGWMNGEDLPGNFLLQLDGDPRYLGIYRNVAAPFRCEEHPDPSVDRSVEAMVDWLTSHRGLVTTEPQAVSIGGLDGVLVDISLDPSWTKTCPYSEGRPIVPFIIGGGPSSLHHVILPGFEERLYLLEVDGGNIAIEVGPEGASLPEFLELVDPIVESLQFTR